MKYIPYRIDFTYLIETEASMYVIAPSLEEARNGGEQMLDMTKSAYKDAEIVNVQEHTPPSDDETPTFN